eukprot:jgi/Botrbrau1/22143/Bobra.0206s0067.1
MTRQAFQGLVGYCQRSYPWLHLRQGGQATPEGLDAGHYLMTLLATPPSLPLPTFLHVPTILSAWVGLNALGSLFTSARTLRSLITAYRAVQGTVLVLLIVRLLGALSSQRRLSNISTTIILVTPRLLELMVTIMMVAVSLAIFGHILFGSSNTYTQSFQRTFEGVWTTFFSNGIQPVAQSVRDSTSLIVQQSALMGFLGRLWFFIIPTIFVICFPGFVLTIILAEFHSAQMQNRGAPGIHNDLARLIEERWQVCRGAPSDARLNRFLKAAASLRKKGSFWSRLPSAGSTILRRLTSKRKGRFGLRVQDGPPVELVQLHAMLASRLESGKEGVVSFQELRAVASIIMNRYGEVIPEDEWPQEPTQASDSALAGVFRAAVEQRKRISQTKGPDTAMQDQSGLNRDHVLKSVFPTVQTAKETGADFVGLKPELHLHSVNDTQRDCPGGGVSGSQPPSNAMPHWKLLRPLRFFLPHVSHSSSAAFPLSAVHHEDEPSSARSLDSSYLLTTGSQAPSCTQGQSKDSTSFPLQTSKDARPANPSGDQLKRRAVSFKFPSRETSDGEFSFEGPSDPVQKGPNPSLDGEREDGEAVARGSRGKDHVVLETRHVSFVLPRGVDSELVAGIAGTREVTGGPLSPVGKVKPSSRSTGQASNVRMGVRFSDLPLAAEVKQRPDSAGIGSSEERPGILMSLGKSLDRNHNPQSSRKGTTSGSSMSSTHRAGPSSLPWNQKHGARSRTVNTGNATGQRPLSVGTSNPSSAMATSPGASLIALEKARAYSDSDSSSLAGPRGSDASSLKLSGEHAPEPQADVRAAGPLNPAWPVIAPFTQSPSPASVPGTRAAIQAPGGSGTNNLQGRSIGEAAPSREDCRIPEPGSEMFASLSFRPGGKLNTVTQGTGGNSNEPSAINADSMGPPLDRVLEAPLKLQLAGAAEVGDAAKGDVAQTLLPLQTDVRQGTAHSAWLNVETDACLESSGSATSETSRPSSASRFFGGASKRLSSLLSGELQTLSNVLFGDPKSPREGANSDDDDAWELPERVPLTAVLSRTSASATPPHSAGARELNPETRSMDSPRKKRLGSSRESLGASGTADESTASEADSLFRIFRGRL